MPVENGKKSGLSFGGSQAGSGNYEQKILRRWAFVHKYRARGQLLGPRRSGRLKRMKTYTCQRKRDGAGRK